MNMAYGLLAAPFDFMFKPLLGLHPFLIIFIITLIANIIITVIYMLVTDQDLMKRLKQDQKDMQKKMKELKNDPDKFMEHQKLMWAKSMEYMKHSMKPTLFTFLPIIILFGWLSSNIAYDPIHPNGVFNVSMIFEDGVYGNVSLSAMGLVFVGDKVAEIKEGVASWKLKGDEGKYILEFSYNNQLY